MRDVLACNSGQDGVKRGSEEVVFGLNAPDSHVNPLRWLSQGCVIRPVLLGSPIGIQYVIKRHSQRVHCNEPRACMAILLVGLGHGLRVCGCCMLLPLVSKCHPCTAFALVLQMVNSGIALLLRCRLVGLSHCQGSCLLLLPNITKRRARATNQLSVTGGALVGEALAGHYLIVLTGVLPQFVHGTLPYRIQLIGTSAIPRKNCPPRSGGEGSSLAA
jgi:hypothetical protein